MRTTKVVKRRKGTKAQRRNGVKAQWRKGAMAAMAAMAICKYLLRT